MSTSSSPLKRSKYIEEEELNIDFLPDEMLLEVFQHLDEKSLVAASKCCLRWDDLIKSDLNLMKKIEYAVLSIDRTFKVFKSIDEGKYRNLFIGAGTRIVNNESRQNISIRGAPMTELPDEIFNELKACRNSIKNVTLTNVTATCPVDILNQLKFIEKLTLANVAQQPLTTTNLPHLKHLEVYDSSDFLSCIKNHDLRVLKIRDIPQQKFNLISDFLQTCPSLKELMITCDNRVLFRLNSVNFELSILSIENTSLQDQFFLEFLQTQQKSLRKLSVVSGMRNLNIQKSLEFVFYEMNLSSLEINLGLMGGVDVFVNETIKKLVIWDFSPLTGRNFGNDPLWLEKLEKLLLICRKVEDLSIYRCQKLDEALLEVSRKISGLKILKIDKVPPSISPVVSFDKLIHLEIDEVRSSQHYQVLPYLVAYCGNLKILKINNLFNFNEDEIRKVILSAKQLEEVNLGTERNFSNAFKETMQQLKHCGRSLKVLRSKHFKLTRDEPKTPLKYESSSFFANSEFKCNHSALRRNFEKIKSKMCKYCLRDV